MRENKVDVLLDGAQLWLRLLEGDQEAFSVLFHYFHPPLYQYGYRICKDEELTRDSIQTVFLKLWDTHTRLKPVVSVKAYLFRSLRNEIIKKIEYRRKSSDHQHEWAAFEMNITFSAEEVATQAEIFQMRKEALSNALNGLSKREREVVYLRYYEDLGYKEISGIVGINYQSVLNYLHQAFNKLRKNAILRRTIELGIFILAGICLP